jgi:hypothetical protein
LQGCKAQHHGRITHLGHDQQQKRATAHLATGR